MSYTWIEPFAGGLAVGLRLVGGRQLIPPVSYMGGKRRYARVVADAMGVPQGRPDRIVISDAGPWGWVWPLVFSGEGSRAVASVLRSWQGEHPRDLWERLASSGPFDDPCERAAQWLWLQARSASGVPIWWDGWRLKNGKRGRAQSTWDRFGEDNAGRWRQDDHATGRTQKASQSGLGWLASDGNGVPRPSGEKWSGAWEQGSGGGKPPQPAGQRGSWRFDARPGDKTESRPAAMSGGSWRMGEEVNKSKRGDRTISQKGTAAGRTGGMVNTATIAERIEGIALAFARVSIDILHGDAAELDPRGGYCYLDPPYLGATGYGWKCTREEVHALAVAWKNAGAFVAVSEREPLDLEGWHHLEITIPGGKPEWLTLSRAPVTLPTKQTELFA